MTANTETSVDVTSQKTAESGTFSSLGDALGTVVEKFEASSAHARESAKVVAQATSKAFAGGTYHIAYWISYGLVYSAVYLTELLPKSSSLRQGLEEGAGDAQARAHHKKTTVEPEPESEGKVAEPKSKTRTSIRRRAKGKAQAEAAATA